MIKAVYSHACDTPGASLHASKNIQNSGYISSFVRTLHTIHVHATYIGIPSA